MKERLHKDVCSQLFFFLHLQAHWCPPCRAFTPQLAKTYKKLKAEGKNFEIIFVSSDKDEAQFNEYFAEMPWVALPYSERNRKEQLSGVFQVEGIPTLVILDKNGNVIRKDGRSAVASDPEGADFPWKPKALNPLTEDFLDGINEHPALLCLNDAKDADAVQAVLKPLGDDEEAKAKIGMVFFYVPTEDSADEQLRGFLRLPKGPQLVLLDIPSQRRFVAPKAEFTAENINQFVSDFRQNKLEGAQGVRG